jgi:hypothetical protein
MTSTDYLISTVLVLLVIPQIRGMRISLRSLLMPLVAVAAAALYYLKSVPTGGNDVQLDLVLGLVGVVLGVLTGVTTKIVRDREGYLVAKAGVIAAVLWILGMAARTAFVYYAEHSGAHAVTTFSINHQITGSAAWTAALVLMSLVQVLARTAAVRIRARMAGPRRVEAAAAGGASA